MIRHIAAVLLTGVGLFASSTASWEMNTYADFMRGRFSGVSLTRDGRVVLAPRLTPLRRSYKPRGNSSDVSRSLRLRFFCGKHLLVRWLFGNASLLKSAPVSVARTVRDFGPAMAMAALREPQGDSCWRWRGDAFEPPPLTHRSAHTPLLRFAS